VLGLDGLDARAGGGGQGVVGEGVDAPHDALGGVEERLVSGGGEQRPVEPGELEAVLQGEPCGVAVEAAQGEADGDALGESFEVRQERDLAQAGLAGQEHGKPTSGVPIEVGWSAAKARWKGGWVKPKTVV
jgi:hypothetical protein